MVQRYLLKSIEATDKINMVIYDIYKINAAFM